MERSGNIMGGKILASILPVLCGVIGVLAANLPLSFMGEWVPSPLYALCRSISGAWYAPILCRRLGHS